MKKIVKYELTREEKDLLTECAGKVAKDCDCDCHGGCPFYLEHEDQCILERLEEIADSLDY